MENEKLYGQKYEYDMVAVNDRPGGGVNLDEIWRVTARYAAEGWRLTTVFTNELGKNSMSMGGFGVNSTMDQTILVFEREVIRLEEKKKAFEAFAPVLESNIVTPFVPKEARFFEKDGSMFVTLRIFSRNDFELRGLQGDLAVKNVLGDEAVLEDVCFFAFEAASDGYYVSSPFPVKLPDKISYGVASAGLAVKRYIGSEGLMIPENTALSSIAETQEANAKETGLGSFLYEADGLENAQAIKRLMVEAAQVHPGFFTEEAMERMDMFVKMELNYGNAKTGVMKFLTEYFDARGMK